MKKIIAVLLTVATAVTCAFALTACKKSEAKYSVGAQAGTTGELYLKGDEDMAFPGYKNIQGKGYDSIGQAVEDMINGNINCVISDIAPANEIASQKTGAVKVIDIPLSSESYAIGVNKNDSALLSDINGIFQTKKTEIDAIIAKYQDENFEPTGIPAGKYDASKSQLVVATNAEFPPFEYTQGSNFVGIDIEIAKLIAEELGQELVIVNMDFDAVVTSVGNNGVDIAIAGLTVKESRKKSVNFTDSYYTDSYQVLIVKADDTTFDNCKTKEDVENILKNK